MSMRMDAVRVMAKSCRRVMGSVSTLSQKKNYWVSWFFDSATRDKTVL